MSYMAGLGAGKGWHFFRFVITPKELRSVFSDLDYWFVKTNQRVPINYTVEDKESLFRNYKIYFEKVFSGKPLSEKTCWKIESGIRTSIIDDFQKIEFKPVIDKDGNKSKEFKLVRPGEPVINVSSFSLNPTISGSFSVAYYDLTGKRNIGLELNYPKFISLESENYGYYHETSDFSTTKLFFELQNRIKKITKKAKIIKDGKLIKPNFWISPKCVEIFHHNFNNATENVRAI